MILYAKGSLRRSRRMPLHSVCISVVCHLVLIVSSDNWREKLAANPHKATETDPPPPPISKEEWVDNNIPYAYLINHSRQLTYLNIFLILLPSYLITMFNVACCVITQHTRKCVENCLHMNGPCSRRNVTHSKIGVS